MNKIIPTALAAAVLSIVVVTPNASASVLYIPGTGGTTPGTTQDAIIGPWIDNGRYGSGPLDCICDSTQYPATLGPGQGQQSVDAGVEATVAYVLAHPEVTELVGGSQGAMVAYRAAGDPRLADRALTVRIYSNPDTPGTGVTARTPSNGTVTWADTRGGVPAQPSNPGTTTTSISHEWDPIAYFPRYQWTYPFTFPTAVLGFLVYHGDLGNIDYTDAEVSQDGTLTTIKLKDPFTPYGKLVVMAANGLFGPEAARVVGILIKPVDDIVAGFLALGGQWDPGLSTFAPTPETAINQLGGIANGFVKAVQDTIDIPRKLTTPPPAPVVHAPVAPAPDPQPTDVPDVNASLVSVPKVEAAPESAKISEPVKDEPKPEVKDEPKVKADPEKDTVADGNKFSPGDTVADKVKADKDDEPKVTDTTDGNKVTPAATVDKDEPKTGSDSPGEVSAPSAPAASDSASESGAGDGASGV